MNPSSHHHGRRGIGCSVLAGVMLSLPFLFFGFHALAPAQGLYSGLSVLPGDADCDGVISIADVTRLVEHIFQQRPLPDYCSDSVTIYADTSLVIKRLIVRIDSTQSVCGTYFSRSWLQKFLIFKRGRLVDSAAWQYVMLPISWNRNIAPPESLGVNNGTR